MKKVSVIIVNYNVSHFLEQALLSVRKALEYIDGEVIVVDNNSADRSVEMVKQKFPEVILVANQQNVGFSKANNIGIKMSKGEYVLLLNPDTVIEEDTLLKCCNFMDTKPLAGGLGVKMLDGKGDFLPESKRGLPTPWVAFCKVFGLSAIFPKTKLFGGYHLGYLDKEKIHEIEILSGAFMLMRKSALDKVGLLDEEYFMYGEDIDLSYRLIKSGYKNYYFPDTRIIHYKGESTKRTSVNYVFVFYRAMIIFAKRHFSNSNAGLFSMLINFAIYIRASIDIGKRVFGQIWLPILDFISIFIGMNFLKSYWEIHHKHIPGLYPDEFIFIIVPVYIFIWLLSIFFSGGYDKPLHITKVIRGVLFGTIMISSISNFFDELRYSKALIVLGAAYAIISFVGIRILKQFVKYGNFSLGEALEKKIIIVGNEEEFLRVSKILSFSNVKFHLLGFVSVHELKSSNEFHLGNLTRIKELIEIYKINELIFCSKDLAAAQIIELMSVLDSSRMEYKIVPDDTNFIIGSNSKEGQGDLYTVDVELQILNKSSRRNKRILDIIVSFTLLIFSPIMLFLVEEPLGLIKNIFRVIVGKYSWVGLSHTNHLKNQKIKKGVLNPVCIKKSTKNLDENTVRRLEILYAKDYETFLDFNIIISAFRKLGNSVA